MEWPACLPPEGGGGVSGPVDIYSSEGSPQTNNIYQSSERPN